MDEGEYVLVSYEDGTSLATTSPFAIAAEIRRMVGEIYTAKPTASGKLQILTKTSDQTETLLKQSLFLEKRASFTFDDKKNSVEAYAYAPSLQDVPEDQPIQKLKSQGCSAPFAAAPGMGSPTPEYGFVSGVGCSLLNYKRASSP